MTYITFIWIFCAFINFIVALYYYYSFIDEKKYSNELNKQIIDSVKYNCDLEYSLYYYKVVYDKYYNKLPKDDFDVYYAKKHYNHCPEVVSVINRIRKDDFFRW